MEKEIIHAFLDYKYRPMSDKHCAGYVLVMWTFSSMSAFMAHLLLKPYIARTSLIFALGFTVYTFRALYKYDSNNTKSGSFIYEGVFSSCFLITIMILAYIACFADGAEGIFMLPLLVMSILLLLTAISIPLSLLLMQRNIKKGKYKQTASQVNLGLWTGFIGLLIARAITPHFKQSEILLIGLGLIIFLSVGMASSATKEFYRYYLAKKYEIE